MTSQRMMRPDEFRSSLACGSKAPQLGCLTPHARVAIVLLLGLCAPSLLVAQQRSIEAAAATEAPSADPQDESPRPDRSEFDVTLRQESSGLAAIAALEQQLIKAIASADKSVVAIARVRNEALNPPAGLPGPLNGLPLRPTDADFMPNEFGAGVVIDKAGLILTNYHVLGEVKESAYFVWAQRQPFRARIVAADPWYDLAVLSVPAKHLVPIKFSDGRRLRKGQFVIALGNPQGIARDGEASASWGIVANLLRRAPRVPRRSSDPLGRETIHQFGTLIQTDAKLNVGFSGGALINLSGEMVGLTTSYAAGVGFESAAGLAVPVDGRFRRVVESLKEGKQPEYGFLGISPEPVELALRQRGVLGAQVSEVLAGTPAAAGGLKAGDLVVGIEGEPVHDDDDLTRIVSSLAPETTVNLQVVRKHRLTPNPGMNRRRVTDVAVLLSKKHLATLRPTINQHPPPDWRGLVVDYVTAVPNFKQVVDRIDEEGCVAVIAVEADSPAWKAGVREGDLVSHAAGNRVTRPADFHASVARRSGVVELLTIPSDGMPQRRSVSP